MKGVGFIFTLTDTTELEYPGLMLESFPIYVSTDVLTPGCHIVNRSRRHEVLVIQDKPVAFGLGFKHSVRMITVDNNDFYPPERLTKNEEFEYTGWRMPHIDSYNMWIYNYIKI